MRSLLIILALSFSSVASAQLEQSAPEELVSSLTARVSAFYNEFQAARFRQAEAYVDAESQERYYNVQKIRILGHEIKSITWSDDFRSAKVMIVAMQMVPMAGTKPVPVPVGGTWNLIDGEWYLHLPAPDSRRTPFGISTVSSPNPGQPPIMIPTSDDVKLPSFTELKSMMSLEETQVVFPAGLTEAVTKTLSAVSKAPEGFILKLESLATPPEGLTVTIEPQEIQPGGKATITVTYDPATNVLSGSRSLRFEVSPTGQIIETMVEFERAPAPEAGNQ